MSYIVTTQIDDYVKYAKNECVDQVFEDITNEVKIINDIIKKTYTGPIIEKLNIKKIIVIENSRSFNGCHLPNNVLVFTLNALRNNPNHTIHHEIMHQIDKEMKTHIDDEEWDKLNKFGYVNDYTKENKRQGFITQYGMKSAAEDKATIYEEFMTRTYTKQNNGLYYDPIIIAKFKLLFERLISFHVDFHNIIEMRNTVENFIFPSITKENKISIKFKETLLDPHVYGGINTQRKIMLLNVDNIYAMYKTILPNNVQILFEQLLEMIINKIHPDRYQDYHNNICLFDSMNHILYMITYHKIKYEISIDVVEDDYKKTKWNNSQCNPKLTGKITLYY